MCIQTLIHRAWFSLKDRYISRLFAKGLTLGRLVNKAEAADLMTRQETAGADLLVNGLFKTNILTNMRCRALQINLFPLTAGLFWLTECV